MVTRGFSLSPLRGSLAALSFGEKSREEKNQRKPLGPGYGHLNCTSVVQGTHRAGIKRQLFGSRPNNGLPF